jgi:hypothetical protein
MKVLKYSLCTKVNHGTEEEPKFEEILTPVTMGWNEVNEEIAKKEAYDGYTIEDDGYEEPGAKPSEEERISDLESALEMLLSGVTE